MSEARMPEIRVSDMTETCPAEPLSLLLVDDEEGIRKVLGLTLADAGWRVRTAASSEEALALFRQQPAPVVLTDIKMPGMDGLGLLRALKELDADTEVILITGHGDIDLAIQGIKLDATDFVTKPIHDDALSIALARARERRAMRRAIREHTENLERLVRQKTRELLDAERLAAVGQTVAGLSHAIKNMASGLEGSLFLLRQGRQNASTNASTAAGANLGDQSGREEYLAQGWEMLEANVQKLKDLSLAMLRFAKPEQLHPEPTDPALPARQVVELLRPRAQAAGTELCLELGQGLAPARLDAAALHRCLLDLVGNALDACAPMSQTGRPELGGPDGSGGRVCVRVEAVEAADLGGGCPGLRYTVADNGCGIAPETLGKLFTAFFSTKGEGGSGLGLLAAKKTVEAHGGTLHVESELGHGSRFIILIPGA